MPKESPIQSSFNTGELSPKLLGRVDLAKYKSGVEVLQNMIALAHGPVTSRGGTQYISSNKTGTEKVRLIEFEFSTEQAYVLEFGHLYIRLYANKAIVASGPFAEEFAAEFDKLSPIEVATPYTEAQLFELQITQDANSLFIAHKSHSPRELVRVSALSWTLSLHTTTFGPYLDLNPDPTLTITPSATTGAITLTASASLFKTTHVDALWRIGTSNGYVKITAFTSDVLVNATVIETLSGIAATDDWSEGAWSTERGFPSAVAIYEQRLYWAGTTHQPQTLWGSQTADYPNHLLGANDSDAVAYTIASKKVNTIQWLASSDLLLVGTSGGVHVASGSTRNTAITPTNIRIVRRSGFGASTVQPVDVANVAAYVQRGGEKLRQIEYEFESDSYSATDLTLLSEHIAKGGFTELAYQQDPDSIVWGVRSDGVLVGMTYEKEQDVFGWHKHKIGGVSDAAGAAAIVESVAVIPGSSNAARDEVWLSVKRWVNGAEVRHIEVMTGGHESGGDIEDAFFVDAGLTYSGDPTTKVVGARHLEGETVSLLVDGAAHVDKVVVDGAVSLDVSASKVHLGFYEPRDVGLLRLEAGSADGTAQGKIKHISAATARVFESVGLTVGATATGQLDRIEFREESHPIGAAVPLYTGDKRIPIPKGYDRDGKLFLRQDQPLPFTLLAVMPKVKTNG